MPTRSSSFDAITTGQPSDRHVNNWGTVLQSEIETTSRRFTISMRSISTPILVGGGLVLAGIVAFLAFGVFAVHTLFIDDVVDEANPFTVTDSVGAPQPAAADDADVRATDTLDTEDTGPTTTGPTTEDSPEAAPPDALPEEPGVEVLTVTSGSFIDGDHPTSGNALTITDGNQTFLRFEGFETDNGPDLNVYLRSSADPDDYIDLGDLAGNIGDQNYELPTDIDLARYDFVDIWCVRFGVSFGSATLGG